MKIRVKETSGPRQYTLLIALVVLVAVAGYVGYVLYPRFDLPAAQGLGLLGLAAAAGMASFFSPCSFPLLLTLLGGHAMTGEQRESRRPALFGAALALGAAVFMLVVGAVIALGGQAAFAGVTFTSTAGIAIRFTVGLVLVVLGLTQAGVLPFTMHRVSRLVEPVLGIQAGMRGDRRLFGFVVFGFVYVLAGFG